MVLEYETLLDIVRLHLRPWRRRLWWLPLAGMLCVVVPCAAAAGHSSGQPLTEGRLRQEWLSDYPVPTGLIWGVVLLLEAVASFGAYLLAYELNRARIRNNVLPELALTLLRPRQIVFGHTICAGLVSAMLLAGACPPLILLGVMSGRGAGELCLGSAVFLGLPFVTAMSEGYLESYRQSVQALRRGGSHVAAGLRSYLSFGVMSCAFMLALTCTWWWPVLRGLRRLPQNSLQQELAPIFLILLLFLALVYGACLLSLLSVVLRFLFPWRRNNWKKHLTRTLLAVGGLGAVAAALIPQVRGILDSTVTIPGTPVALMQGTVLVLSTAAAYVFPVLSYGGSLPLLLQELLGSHAAAMTVLWFACFVAVAVHAVLGRARDCAWLMANPWHIETLQNPRRVRETRRRELRRSHGGYSFRSENPLCELVFARSIRDRVWLHCSVGVMLIVLAVVVFFVALPWYETTVPIMEEENLWIVGSLLFLPAAGMALGMGQQCGVIIAELKEHRLWSQILITLIPSRAVVAGVLQPIMKDCLALSCYAALLGVFAMVGNIIAGPLHSLLTPALFLVTMICGIVSAGSAALAASLTSSQTAVPLLGFLMALLAVWFFPVSIPLLYWIAYRRLRVEDRA